ncbi:MAG: adenylyltransferase/cytidyltransferase family protein [Candidatus Thermoplasmatota archaeon]|nr:adenylyltransferase/cytidyltransferase family protein [Euryarchaeota archaeon]MBU4031912.1 adenylyltransferase/cytidyltransferase family protein [Candidatus Thermoplasmatota archaeon]MBU4072188.1 adenylyltransferase/cytidyltransferase family protein [Candidatus Thermoplasmatota archaeon]MBU4145010.1 adenylyltransferase/cytidyltransferase family protein [Candidatus Thermoplasmatota archaeon]MBU4592024.1 adenylyltransferase/cytidyltransferase family protein [Candidatus Thermoplasmatota archaeo
MVKVMASGVFDILHPGHLHFLEEAKKLGDELVVVVATDNTARGRKHEPITPQDMRVKMIAALRVVNRAVLGHDGDMYKIVEEMKPDIIALGFDQEHGEDEITSELDKRGLKVRVVRLPQLDHDLSGTRKIMQKVIDWYLVEERLKKVEGR